MKREVRIVFHGSPEEVKTLEDGFQPVSFVLMAQPQAGSVLGAAGQPTKLAIQAMVMYVKEVEE